MKKKLIIVGGANGVGKTTFSHQCMEEHEIDYLGADEIAEKLAATQQGRNIELKAGKEFFSRLEGIRQAGDSVIIESTLSGLSLAKTIERFKSNGYTIQIVYLFLDDAELCKKRIRLRVRKGGHNVLEQEIDRRFGRSLRNFLRVYAPLADTWQLLYNGHKRPMEVAINECGTTMILDDEYYGLFLETAK